MDITIEERLVGHVTILDIVGRLTIDEAAEHLKDKINSLISQNRLQLVLNLARAPYIDSGASVRSSRRTVRSRGLAARSSC